MIRRKTPRGHSNSARLLASVFAVVATIQLASTAGAEEDRTRLRVTDRDATTLVGTFGGLRGDTLLLVDRSDGAPRSIALPAIEKLERSRGIHGHSLAGAGWGLGVGAVIGGVLGNLMQPKEGTGAKYSFATGGAILVGAAGAALGALVGTSWRHEDWRRMPVSELHVLVGLGASGDLEVILAKRF